MLAYECQGTGTPVILLHAFPLSSRMWKDELTTLSRIAKVITPDLPGFGGSASQEKPSIYQLARDIAVLLDSLEIREPVVLGGLSMGGYVVFEFLRQFPERVRGLGLFSTRAGADTPEAREKRLKTVKFIRQNGLEDFTEKTVLNLLGKTTLEQKPEVTLRVREMITGNNAEGVIRALLAMAERRDSNDLLPSIKCPSLVIAGGEDTFIKPSEAEAMHRRIPRSEFHLIPTAGHLPNLEEPDIFQKRLADFIQSCG